MASLNCEYCGDPFKTATIMNMHIKNKHPEKVSQSPQPATESSQRPTSPQFQSRPPQQPQQQHQPFNFQPQSQFQSRPPQQQQPLNFQPPPQPQSQSRPRPIAQQSQSSPPQQQQQQPSNFQPSARPKQPIDDGEISLIRQMKPINSPLGSSGPFKFQSQGKEGEEEEEAKGEGNYENDDYEEGEYQTDSLSSKMKTLATQGNEKRLLETMQEYEIKIVDQGIDPSSPLYSVKKFEDLNLSEELLKGLYAMGFNRPSKIQERALPLLLNPGQDGKSRNMIAQSQSGTGKTAAFSLAMLSKVNKDSPHHQALCLAPSRELVIQIAEQISTMGQFTGIKIATVIPQSNDSLEAQILVGTPGKVFDLIQRRKIATKTIVVFVLDEADIMIDSQGLGDQSLRIKNVLNPDCQMLFFSATYKERVMDFAQKIAPNANTITLKKEELTVEGIRQYFIQCKDEENKIVVLMYIYGILTVGSGIIFFQTKSYANKVYTIMKEEGYSVALLHSELQGFERDQVMEDFRKGKAKVLISTNVIARGIDISQVSLVVNFDLPLTFDQGVASLDYETYLHRIGRTGRFGREGTAINFLTQQTSHILPDLENYFGIKLLELPSDLPGLQKVLPSFQS